MNEKSAIHLAIISGFFGSGGSILAKLAGHYGMDDWLTLSAKVALLALMLLVNTASLTLFSRALAKSTSSLQAVVGAAAVNYLCSTIVGWLFFDEPTSLLRCCGITVVLLGIVVMMKAKSNRPKVE